jgi:hypothetical protein
VTGERYQGIVPLDGGSLAEAAESYFASPSRLPSLVRFGFAGVCPTGAGFRADASSSICPRARRGASACTPGSTIPNGSMSRRSAATVAPTELTDPALPLDPVAVAAVQRRGRGATRFVIANDPRTATVSYSCRSGGSGQTTIRADRAGVVKIHTQGILRNEPFDYSVEARRVGACSVAANAGGGR